MERIKSLDLARGFTVGMIAPIHTVLLYSQPEVHHTLLGYFLAFIAEGPGAQLFMVLMGIYFSFHPQPGFIFVLKRSIFLLTAAYALNIFKFLIPLALGWLPPALLSDLDVPFTVGGGLQLLMLGDILHFAALAILVLFFIRKLKQWNYWALIFAVLICFAAPIIWDTRSNYFLADYMLQLFAGQPPKVFFPLFPWLIYPLLGLALGHFMKLDSKRVFRRLGAIGIILLIAGVLMKIFFITATSPSFYRTLPLDTLLHVSIVLLTLSVWNWLSAYVRPNPFFRLLNYMSQHITQIYLIQWVVIMWLLPVFGYQRLGYALSLLAIVITTFFTFSISIAINLLRK